uniref:Uncharacterized protein n=1 Tax=Vespula pensylvanica TaxID=30213 RepID=A0A834UF58_VESPE|nr:hypothetical protein H0235_003453 [Vespula pensylvanica]
MLVGVNRIEGRLENPKCNHPYRSSMTVQLTRIASHKGCRSQVARLTALGQSVLLLGCVLADFRGLPRVSVKRARSSSTALSIPTKLETPLRTLRLALSMRLLEPLARSGWMERVKEASGILPRKSETQRFSAYENVPIVSRGLRGTPTASKLQNPDALTSGTCRCAL